MNLNPLRRIEDEGQAIWLDDYDHELLDGRLEQLIEQDGLKGLTSNPAIFQKAMAKMHDAGLSELKQEATKARSPKQLYEAVAVRQLQAVADKFRPLHDATDGWHGWVSLEVDPGLAFDSERTQSEARRLHAELARPNTFIKVPATREGLLAIVELISEGINVNVTLLFGLPRYRSVLEAYMTGLEKRLARGLPIDRVQSVASFFLSRIDSLVDPRLQDLVKRGGTRAVLAKQLYGSVALASAKLAYAHYQDNLQSARWQALAKNGARAQWLLWGSTSTKNPNFDELKYVEPLIGPETINTMPPHTLDIYRRRGQPANRLGQGTNEARETLEQLTQLGIDIDEVTEKLEAQGVEKFAKPFDDLLAQLRRYLQAA